VKEITQKQIEKYQELYRTSPEWRQFIYYWSQATDRQRTKILWYVRWIVVRGKVSRFFGRFFGQVV